MEEFGMKRYILLAIFTAAFTVAASTPAAHAADAKDFPIKVHVSSSELKPGVNGLTQFIAVVIDGKKYELELNHVSYRIIHPGDYQARMVSDQSLGTGEFDREYEILFADGKTAKYEVAGEFE
jgi:hypothetical protein